MNANFHDDADELDVDITEINEFEEITFENSSQVMTAIIDPEENITFQDVSNMSHELTCDNYSIVASDNLLGSEDITFSEGSNSCTFKIEYPMSDSSVNCSGKCSRKVFAS